MKNIGVFHAKQKQSNPYQMSDFGLFVQTNPRQRMKDVANPADKGSIPNNSLFSSDKLTKFKIPHPPQKRPILDFIGGWGGGVGVYFAMQNFRYFHLPRNSKNYNQEK